MEDANKIVDAIGKIVEDKEGTEIEVSQYAILIASVAVGCLIKAVHMTFGVDCRQDVLKIVNGVFDETLLNKEAE